MRTQVAVAWCSAIVASGLLLATIALAHGTPRGAPVRLATPRPIAAPAARAQPTAPAAPPTEAELHHRAQVVARFEGGQVTVGALEDAIRAQSPYLRQRYANPETRKELLARTVRFELLANEAERRGFGARDSVQETVKQNAVQRMMKETLDDKITAEQVPAEQIKTYYEANLAEFVRPAMRRVSHVMFATLEEARAALAEAREMDMRQFRELARAKSIDEQSNARGGDLGYFDATGKPRDDGSAAPPETIVKAAFELDTVGDTAPEPAKVTGGYSLVKLTGLRPASERTLHDAEATIRSRLWRELRQTSTEAFVEKLRGEIKPVIHPELLGQIDLSQAPDALEDRPEQGTPATAVPAQ